MVFVVTAVLCGAAQSSLLVSTADVDRLNNALLVDARPADAYAAAHIPGALHLDVATLSETRDGVAGLLKPLDAVRRMLGGAGIDPAKRIVVYSAMDTPSDLSSVARLFWILEYVGYQNVAVLDGGFAKWTAEGRKTETGESKAAPIELPEMTVREDRLATAANVDLLIKDKKGTLVDARGADYFRGDKKTDVVKAAGHIPGAVNLPVDTCVAESTALKSWEELQEIAKSSGVQKGAPVVTYCNTGRSASAAYLVLRLLGYENVSMYDGSMAEWTASGGRPVETGK
ncbi:MAG: sulfurtransferase [Candidatus Hydrogenedentes bacterium]|nr:sulfurtransferase [Candidatus Hydrogenedentota bacterium]